jgi:hypothetical protein
MVTDDESIYALLFCVRVESLKMCDNTWLPTCFEDLAVELIRIIVEYVATHDLIFAFENLNSSFVSIIRQLPLYLPDNANMSIAIYRSYITDILPKYRSQIGSLHLSERQSVDAVEWLLRVVEHNPLSAFTTSLRIIKIVDIRRSTLELLIDQFHLVPHVQTLSITLDMIQWTCADVYADQYSYLQQAFYWPTIVSSLPKLRSLSISHNLYESYFGVIPDYNLMSLPIAENLHTLTIQEFPWLLITTLLNGGHVPNLRCLNLEFGSLFDSSWFVAHL